MKKTGLKIFLLLFGLFISVFLLVHFGGNSPKPTNHDTQVDVSKHSLPQKLPVVAPPVNIVTSTNTDERLFLVNLLEEMYADWPVNTTNQEEITAQLGNLRFLANRHLEDIKRRNLDEDLETLYQDFISAVDAYTDYLSQIGVIQKEAMDRAEKESAESGFNAGWSGAEVGFQAHDNGDSTSSAIFQGLATAAIVGLWDDYNKSKERDAAEQQAIGEARQELQNTFSTIISRAQSLAAGLSQKYSWERGEATFLGAAATRQRDPFLISDLAFNSIASDSSANDRRDAAQRCIAAACLVPEGRIYDNYRTYFLQRAGDLLDQAANIEIGQGAWADAYNQTAATAVQIWNDCLKFDPQDATGEYRERKAWDLFKSGDLDEALKQASSVQNLKGNTIRYAYYFSCLLSDLHDTKDSYAWLEYAIKSLGYYNIHQAKIDPDLENMRAAETDRFNNLTTVKWSWYYTPGIFNDDLTVTNDSAFALTDVTFNASLQGSDGHTYSKTLMVDEIAPGQGYTWFNCISIPGGNRNTSGKTTLSADQMQ